MKLDDFALMVSEVVTNAAKHRSPEADGNIGLRLEGDQDALRVVVTDGGQVFAIDPGSLDPDRDESFGLLLVDKLADRWGTPWMARRPSGWRLTPLRSLGVSDGTGKGRG